jgi:hypothetical protein
VCIATFELVLPPHGFEPSGRISCARDWCSNTSAPSRPALFSSPPTVAAPFATAVRTVVRIDAVNHYLNHDRILDVRPGPVAGCWADSGRSPQA